MHDECNILIYCRLLQGNRGLRYGKYSVLSVSQSVSFENSSEFSIQNWFLRKTNCFVFWLALWSCEWQYAELATTCNSGYS